MPLPARLRGHILTDDGFILGKLIHEQGRIVALHGKPVPEQDVRDSPLPLILPGFIDPHVHGGGGADVMDGGDAVSRLSRLHARHGTTALLATTLAAPRQDLVRALTDLAPLCARRAPGGARVLGVHLEGPYFNPHQLGAQPDFARGGDLDEVDALARIAPILLVTVAPELPGHLDFITALRERGIRVQLGHTEGTYEQGVDALAHGATGFTHLFNVMGRMHHRAPGMIGAALAHARYAEIIPDLLHVHPGAILVALRAIPCVYCVSDSTSATGMPDGPYRLGRQTVHKCRGAVRLADGTLAGSTLTMDTALRNMVSLGLTLADASARVSTHAADFLGLPDRGRLRIGAWADLVVLDTRLQLQHVLAEGEYIDLTTE